jgi:hypothetical protein
VIIAAPIVDSLKPLQQFVFNGLTWKQYETLLESLGERRLRHTYVAGSLEVVTPFPFLSSDDLNRFIDLRQELDDTELELQFEAWVREQL